MGKLEETFGCHPKFPTTYQDDKGAFKDRVARHDAVHLLMIERSWPVVFTVKDEYAAAVVQAVLVREKKVSDRVHAVGNDALREPPTLEDMHSFVLPRIPGFIEKVMKDRGMQPPQVFPEVNPDAISRHYQTAREFDRMFEEAYGKPFYQTSAEALMDMEFEPLKQLYRVEASKVKFQKSEASSNVSVRLP